MSFIEICGIIFLVMLGCASAVALIAFLRRVIRAVRMTNVTFRIIDAKNRAKNRRDLIKGWIRNVWDETWDIGYESKTIDGRVRISWDARTVTKVSLPS